MKATARRVCLFTGISGTLGRDFAARYADAYDLVGVYNSVVPEGPTAEIGRQTAEGPGAFYVAGCDLAEEGAIDRLVDQVLSHFGGVDLLVNAAVYRRFGPVTAEGFARSLEWQFVVNVCVPLELTATLARRSWAATPETNRERNRNVINLSSTAGHAFYPGQGQTGYGCSKAALNLATVHLADELAPIGVRANALAPNTFPGLIPTESVSELICRYDHGSRSGDIYVMDTDGEYPLDLSRSS